MIWLITKAMAIVIPLRFDPDKAQGIDTTIALRVRVRSRLIELAIGISGGACTVRPEAAHHAGATATVGLPDLIRLVLGDVGWPQLLSRGRFALTGDPFLAMRLPALFRLPVGARGQSPVAIAPRPSGR